MKCVLDVQFLKKPINEFIAKELSVIPIESEKDNIAPLTFLFQPPHKWTELPVQYRSENCWLERNFHGLRWSSGMVPYTLIFSILHDILSDVSEVYVKGEQKQHWLQSIMTPADGICVIDLKMFNCPALWKLRKQYTSHVKCENHSQGMQYSCAAENVKLLKTWYFSDKKKCSIK